MKNMPIKSIALIFGIMLLIPGALAYASLETSESIISFTFVFLMISLTVLFGWIGFKLSENEKLWVLGLFFIILSLFFVIYDLYLAMAYQPYTPFLTDDPIPGILFYAMFICLGAGLLVSAVMLFKYLPDYMKRMMRMNESGKQEREKTSDE